MNSTSRGRCRKQISQQRCYQGHVTMTAGDESELFFNAKMLVSHNKKGHLKNTWFSPPSEV